MNRPRRERRWQSPKDRARVAAELIEEAESLSETGLIATPADLAKRPLPIRVAPPVAAAAVPAPAPAPLAAAAVHVSPPEPSAPAEAPPPPLPPLAAVPNEADALLDRGRDLSRRGLWSEAARVLQRAVTADGSRSTAWYYLGEALNHLDDLSGALAAFSRAAELEPAHAKAFYGQGIVLDRLNRPEDATRMYRRARDVNRR